MGLKIVQTVSDLLENLKSLEVKRKRNQRMVYRGENSNYGATACSPNIFRNENLKKNKAYEINIYNGMYAKGVVPKQSFLDTAIDAQHGGFPSRLLDVSYNVLVALYFATEINFEEEEKQKSKILLETKNSQEPNNNPVIFVFFIDQIYVPGSFNSEDLFEKLINPSSPFKDLHISSFNHKLIDHMNKNERIKAQQGAFLLFQGSEFVRVPEYMFETIEIDRTFAKQIQEELKCFFGITKGSIYPEANNQIDLIKDNADYIYSNEITILNEFQLAISTFNKIIDYHLVELTKIINNQDHTNVEEIILQKVIEIERELHKFKEAIEQTIINNEILAKHFGDEYREFKNDLKSLYSDFIYENRQKLMSRLRVTKIKPFVEKEYELKIWGVD